MNPYPIVYKHADGKREIHVYADYKRRVLGRYTSSGKYPVGDEWPVLWRHEVASLTEEQWQAPPAEEGWSRV